MPKMCTVAGKGVSFPWLHHAYYTLVREIVVEDGYLEISTSYLHNYGEHIKWPKDVLGEEGSGTPHLPTSGREAEACIQHEESRKSLPDCTRSLRCCRSVGQRLRV